MYTTEGANTSFNRGAIELVTEGRCVCVIHVWVRDPLHRELHGDNLN